MLAYDIATLPSQWGNVSPDAVHSFIRFVKATEDPVVKGLVSMMAEEIQRNRLDEKVYMGKNSQDMRECIIDSEVLMARVLLDESSHGSPPGYVIHQLRNIAWYIATEEKGEDSFHNWRSEE